MTKSKSKNQIDKNLFEPTELDFLDGVDVASNIIISKMTPKVANIVRKRLKEGGTTNDKPKPSNVINFPIKPNMPLYEWWKTEIEPKKPDLTLEEYMDIKKKERTFMSGIGRLFSKKNS